MKTSTFANIHNMLSDPNSVVPSWGWMVDFPWPRPKWPIYNAMAISFWLFQIPVFHYGFIMTIVLIFIFWALIVQELLLLQCHCGRNTHFRRICFSGPNFNYMKFEDYKTTGVILEKITQKLASRENYTSEKIKYTIFFIILQVTTSIVIVYRPQ